MADNIEEVMLSAVLEKLVLPVIQGQVKDIMHTCGKPYDVHFLNRDGILVRAGNEGYEATVAARCTECRESPTSFSYARLPMGQGVSPSGIALVIENLGPRIEMFKAHLEQVQEGKWPVGS